MDAAVSKNEDETVRRMMELLPPGPSEEKTRELLRAILKMWDKTDEQAPHIREATFRALELGILLSGGPEDSETFTTLVMVYELKHKASELGYAITEEQASNILANQAVSHTLVAAPLTPEEREVAEELLYVQVKELSRGGMTDAELRDFARSSVAWSERGPTSLQRIGHASGCFQLLLGLLCGLALSAMVLGIAFTPTPG